MSSRKLRFRPNAVARSLRTKQSQTVAVLVPDITNPYYPVLARGLQDALAEAGYHVFICNTDGMADKAAEFLADVVQRRVDGIVIEEHPLDAALARALVPSDVPIVALQGTPESRGVDAVVLDEEAGAFAVGRFLLELGHRTFACLAGPTGNRQRGFIRALEDARVTLDWDLVIADSWTRVSGATAMEQLLAREVIPTAVFAANDLIAIGAMDAFRSWGLAVPQDVSLVGFDDIEAAALVTPPLTTVRNSAYEAGRAAAEILLERIADPSRPGTRQCVTSCSLVKRSSAIPLERSRRRHRELPRTNIS